MTCGETRLLFSPYVDGELGRKARLRLEAHLAQCGPCRAELDRYAQFLGGLTLGLKAAGGRYVSQAAPFRLHKGPSPAAACRRRRFLLPAAAAASVLLAVLGASRLFNTPDGVPATTPPESDRAAGVSATSSGGGECQWLHFPASMARSLASRGMLIPTSPHPDLSLQDVAVSVPDSCGDKVRLCYDSAEGPVILEGATDFGGEESCQRRVEAAGFEGCMIEPTRGGFPRLTWQSGATHYSLTAEVSESRIIELAMFIDDAASEHATYY